MSDEGDLTRRAALLLMASGASAGLAKTSGFTSIEALRGASVDVADLSTALIGISGHDVTVDDKKRGTTIATIENNADVPFALDVDVSLGDGLRLDESFDSEVGVGETTSLAVTCKPGSGSGTSSVEIDVRTADGDGLTITGVSTTIDVERDCPGRSKPGPGFDSIYAEDVSGFVKPGEERQTFSFVLAKNRKKDEQIEIHLSRPRGGVDYARTFSDPQDVRIETGAGSVWLSGDSIVYQVSNKDKNGDRIVLSVGDYSTDGNGGPFTVDFLRRDTGETGSTTFEIDGEAGAGDPFLDVHASDVSANVEAGDERQQFSFTPGRQLENWSKVEIDLTDPRDDGVNYDGTFWDPQDLRVDRGSGGSDEIWGSGSTIVYQATPDDYAGEEIVVSAGSFETGDESGPFMVTFTREDTGDQATDEFHVRNQS